MFFEESVDHTLKELYVKPQLGLSPSEVQTRLEKYGLNKLIEKKGKTLFQMVLSQLNDVLIYILIGAALISSLLGEISDSVIIALVIVINAIVGVLQESKAEKSLEALKKLSNPKAVVRREGRMVEISSEEVVPGDIVIIDAGRYIPCDMRLIESSNLKIEESSLTGESVPSEKKADIILDKENTPLGDQINMAFMSTLVTYGRGVGVAVCTGMNTEIGKIAGLLEHSDAEKTPLQKRLEVFGKYIGIGILFLCAIMFVIGAIEILLSGNGLDARSLLDMFMTSVSLAVAAIPEGLPAIVTIVLAIGVQKMIKENAIIRKLPAVETLGSVNIICSDKTGTLTQNKMTVTRFYCNNFLGDIDKLNLKESSHRLLLENLILCNDATFSLESKTGDPTEIALLEAGSKFNLFKDEIVKIHERIDELPFDSDRKLMTTVNKYKQNYYVMTKGAVGNLLNICSNAYWRGKITPINDEIKNEIFKFTNMMSDDALRVLGAAYKEINSQHIEIDRLENDLIFIGMIGMIDPPRLEAKASIELCKKSGIIPVMITGDHKNTAFAIAKELKIATEMSQAISGNDLDKLTADELAEKVNNLRVFARVSPEHKVKIVRAFKANGNIVSMTGDGVNDAPSLKAADIGIAMGITGTDVAKGASDMILTDDNFSTILKAIEEGRNIYSNIKKSILFLLSCNAGEILAIFSAVLIGFTAPLKPIHILWVNLITDVMPALALGMDPGDPNVMNYKPRMKSEKFFSKLEGLRTVSMGIIIGFLTLYAYSVGMKTYAASSNSLTHAQTLAFVVLSFSQLFHSFNMRHSEKSIFQLGIYTNKLLVFSLLIGILLQITIITVPTFAAIFKLYTLNSSDWVFVFLLSLVPILIDEILKIFLRLNSQENK